MLVKKMSRAVALWFVVVFAATGAASCAGGTNGQTDSGTDAGVDAGSDAGNDAGYDGADQAGDPASDPGPDSDSGIVEGYALLAGQADHSAIEVVIDGLVGYQAITGANGFYLISDVPAGNYNLTVSRTGYQQRSSAGFEVNAGQTVTVETLTLAALQGDMGGYVLLEGESEHAGTLVEIQGGMHATNTSNTGHWSISDVAVGNYTIVASHSGFLSDSVSDQSVVAGQLTTVTTMTLVAKGDLGEACLDETTCDSGICVEDVCCNADCDGFCETCSGDIDGSGEVEVDEEGFKGACTQYLDGADPNNECADTGECRPACDGSGGCNLVCVDQGGDCTADAECVTGHCTDNICCNESQVDCGNCRRCDITDSEGTCTLVAEGQDSQGDCSTEEPSTCGTTGNCAAGGACQYYGPATSCDDQNECTINDHCDLTGSCAVDPQVDFTACSLTTATDYWYDFCSAETCISPGTCTDASCNSPGPHFTIPIDKGHSDFSRTVDTQPVVTDNVTGLMWQGCLRGCSQSDCGDCPADVRDLDTDWQTAISYCDLLEWGGFSDWYLPDEFELHSIIEYSREAPNLDTTAFPGASFSDGYLWSSAQWQGSENKYLYFSLVDGSLHEKGGLEEMDMRALCVRHAQSPLGAQGPRFIVDLSVDGQPLVEDSVTGLIWQRCARGQSGNQCADGNATTVNLSGAVSACSFEWAGEADWRLPTVKELHSIRDNRENPAIAQAAFPIPPADQFWTSTIHWNWGSYNWVVNFDNADTPAAKLTIIENVELSYVRCVRNGQ